MRTQTRASAVAIALILAALVLACSDDTTPSPIAPPPPQPTTPTPAPPATIYSLSGVVFEVTSAGNTPVEGVDVYCDSCGPPIGHSSRLTGADGVYSFDGEGGVTAGGIPLFLHKRGYILPNQPDQSGPNGDSWMGSVSVRVSGDTRFNIQIIRK
jgi:hypothetical protein